MKRIILGTVSLGSIMALALASAACGSDGGATGDTAQTDGAADSDTTGPDAAPDADDTAELAPEWRHDGPIQTAPAAVPEPPYFVEVSDEAGITDMPLRGGRAMVVDFDGDGRDDLVTLPVTVEAPARMTPTFARNAGPDADGQVVFEDVTASSGMADAEAAIMVFGDVDNDGDQDVFTGVSFRAPGTQIGVWLNDGEGHFTYAGQGGFASAMSGPDNTKEMAAAAFGDFDGDGLLDLYIGTWYGGSEGGSFVPPPDELYRGEGGALFAPVDLPTHTNPLTVQVEPGFAGIGRAAYGVAVSDVDGDGDLDIFVNNYGAGRPAGGSPPRYWDHNLLWRNDGDMDFVDVGVEAGVDATERGIGSVEEESPVVMGGETMPGPIGGNGFGCQWGDLDNDGHMDLIVGTIAHPDYPQSDRTMLHYHQGDDPPTFSEESAARGLEYYEDELHPALIDIDQDGRLDIGMSRLRGGSQWEMYLQGDDGDFVMKTYAESGVDITRPGPTVWLDYDGDGDLDFFMGKGTGRLFDNRVGQDNHHLELRLVATAPRDATGARVTLTTSAGVQTREVTSGNGHYNTQLTRHLNFGLGGDSGAADVTIRWPDGSEQVLGDVKANYALEVAQDGEITVIRRP